MKYFGITANVQNNNSFKTFRGPKLQSFITSPKLVNSRTFISGQFLFK